MTLHLIIILPFCAMFAASIVVAAWLHWRPKNLSAGSPYKTSKIIVAPLTQQGSDTHSRLAVVNVANPKRIRGRPLASRTSIQLLTFNPRLLTQPFSESTRKSYVRQVRKLRAA